MNPRLKTLYRETLLKHSREPENRGPLKDPNFSHQLKNPLCGDLVTIYLKLNDGIIEQARFEAQCCSICMASSSMLTRRIKGSSYHQSEKYAVALIEMLVDPNRSLELPESDELQSLSGVKEFPSRIRCATLPWEAFQMAIDSVE